VEGGGNITALVENGRTWYWQITIDCWQTAVI